MAGGPHKVVGHDKQRRGEISDHAPVSVHMLSECANGTELVPDDLDVKRGGRISLLRAGRCARLGTFGG